jgi:hypothetical protein
MWVPGSDLDPMNARGTRLTRGEDCETVAFTGSARLQHLFTQGAAC